MGKQMKFDDPEFLLKVSEMLDRKMDGEARQMLFEAITEDAEFMSDEIVSRHESCSERIEIVRKILKWYEGREEYEKCAALQNIISKALAKRNADK